MNLLHELSQYAISEADDGSKIPEESLKLIQSNIRKGAADTDQRWSNALHLVHKAYEISNVERPSPDMKAAWKQYETNLQYAVQQLSKSRGLDADWRMSAAVFHEAAKRNIQFSVKGKLPNGPDIDNVAEAEDFDQFIDELKKAFKNNKNTYTLKIHVEDLYKGKKLTFWQFGIRKNAEVTLTLL